MGLSGKEFLNIFQNETCIQCGGRLIELSFSFEGDIVPLGVLECEDCRWIVNTDGED